MQKASGIEHLQIEHDISSLVGWVPGKQKPISPLAKLPYAMRMKVAKQLGLKPEDYRRIADDAELSQLGMFPNSF